MGSFEYVPPVTKGFKTGKPDKPDHPGSLYSIEESTNITRRFKADPQYGDGGLQSPMVAGFLNHRQMKEAKLAYNDKGQQYERPTFAILSRSLERKFKDCAFENGERGKIESSREFEPVLDFSGVRDRTVHLVMRKKSPEDRFTDEWVTLGPVKMDPAVELAPFEIGVYGKGFHCGNKITEVYDTQQELAASIERHGYPVRLGVDNHLEYPPALLMGSDKHSTVFIKRDDGLYSAVECPTGKGLVMSEPVKLEFGNGDTVHISSKDNKSIGMDLKVKRIFDSATIERSTASLNEEAGSKLKVGFGKNAEGRIVAIHEPLDSRPRVILDPNKPSRNGML